MQMILTKVSFRNSPKSYSFKTDLSLEVGDLVVVETVQGLEMGSITAAPQISEVDLYDSGEIKPVLRKATDADKKTYEANQETEKKYLPKIKQMVRKSSTEMKVVSCELSLDGKRLLINFASENRVDFRELVRELAGEFHTRIEMKQIGSRDEVKIVGGLGPCGNPCCCKRFLGEFEHASIKMAKNQGLSPNPVKISGLCGRLMCCLSYENEHYTETNKLMPKIGTMVETPDGKGTAAYNNLLKRTVNVRMIPRYENAPADLREYPLEQLKFEKKNDGCPCKEDND